MTYFMEQDPLLPKERGAPEIHGSRPQSINNVYKTEAVAVKGGSDQNPKVLPRLFHDALALFIVISVIFFLAFTFLPENPIKRPTPIPKTVEQRVTRILSDTPLIDGHNDLASVVRFLYDNHIYSKNFKIPFEVGGMPMHVDLPRLKEGMNGGAFWSAYVPCPKNGTDFSDENYAESVQYTLTQIDLLRRIQEAYPTHFSPPPNSTTALAAFKAGQLISPLAIEGLHQIGNSLANLRHYHSLGVRYATLTHNCPNIYADSALVEILGGVQVAKPVWGGLSPQGKELILEMNRLGMIVDLAHVSQDTMRDVLAGDEDFEGSVAPVIFSHSSAYALCPHPRNVPDDILQLVKDTNSVVMVNFSPDFVSCVANSSNPTGIPDFYPQNSTLEHVVSHITHIGKLIGYDHVGIGSDFDGIPATPKGLDDVSKFPDLVAEMLRQGVSDEDAAKVVGGNVLRVWKDVEIVATKIQSEGIKPIEDRLPSLKWGIFGSDIKFIQMD